MSEARSGVLADMLESLATSCPNIQRLIFKWGCKYGMDIGPQAERALLRLLPQLSHLYAVDLSDAGLSSSCIRTMLALPSIQTNLEEVIGPYQIPPEDLVGLAQCTNLRFVHLEIPYRYHRHNPCHNPSHVTRPFEGLSNLNHLHLDTDIAANDPGLMDVVGDPTRSLSHLSLQFHGTNKSGESESNAVKVAISSNPRLQVLALKDYIMQLDDSSLTALGTLSDLRVIAVYSGSRLTGSFLRHLTPTTNPDLRLVIISGCSAVDGTVFSAFHRRFGGKAEIAIRSGLGHPFDWFTVRPLHYHRNDEDRMDATLNMSCPSAACCVSHW